MLATAVQRSPTVVEPETLMMPEYIHMKCTKVSAFGEKTIPLCNCQPFVAMTSDKKKVTCPKCKKIIKETTKKKKLGYRV